MHIHPTALLRGPIELGESVTIGAYCVLEATEQRPVVVGDGVVMGHDSSVGGHKEIGSNTVADPYTRLGPGSIVGRACHLLYGARMHTNSIVGDACVIAGNVPDNTRFGNRVVHLGKISHSLHFPLSDWDEPSEP